MENLKTLSWLKTKRVAVLKGGWSTERSISLKTGAAVEESFRRMGIKALGIDVKPNIAPILRRKKIQFCFNALHGPFGEDGRLQSLLEILEIPYTGSDTVSSANAMDKDLSKKLFIKAGVSTPPGVSIYKTGFEDNPPEAIRTVKNLLKKGPLFIKPVDQGSAIGVSKVKREPEIGSALKKCFAVSDGALVEKLIVGKELTVGIIGDKALPVTQILSKHDFYDFFSKYSRGGSRHITPAPITSRAAALAQKLALKAFKSLGCSVYGRVDVMMQAESKQFVLEVNTIPGMTNTSLLPEAAQAVGLSFDDLTLEIIRLSLKERKIKI